MSIEVRVPKEITEYTEKIIFGLSIRQLFCFVLAITLGITTYLFTRLYLGTRIAGYLVMIIVLPLFAVGFLRKNGFPFEKYAALLLRHKFGTHKRTYRTELLIDRMPKASEKEVKKNHVFQQGQKETGSKNKRECEVFESTEKSRKRKCKETKRKIKTALEEYRQAKRATKKAIKEAKKPNNSTANDKISTNV